MHDPGVVAIAPWLVGWPAGGHPQLVPAGGWRAVEEAETPALSRPRLQGSDRTPTCSRAMAHGLWKGLGKRTASARAAEKSSVSVRHGRWDQARSMTDLCASRVSNGIPGAAKLEGIHLASQQAQQCLVALASGCCGPAALPIAFRSHPDCSSGNIADVCRAGSQ